MWYTKHEDIKRDVFVIEENANLAFKSVVKFQSLDALVKKNFFATSHLSESKNYCIAMIGQCFNHDLYKEPIILAFKSPMQQLAKLDILSRSALFKSSNISKLVTKIPDTVTPLEEKEETNTPKKFDLMLD